MAKSTQAELNQRVTEVSRLLLDGFTRSHILEYARNQWKVSESMTDNYIAMASKQIKEINDTSIEEQVSMIATNLMQLYRDHYKTNPDLARKILMDLAKIRGLDKVTINLKVEPRDLEAVSDADLLSLLEPKEDE